MMLLCRCDRSCVDISGAICLKSNAAISPNQVRRWCWTQSASRRYFIVDLRLRGNDEWPDWLAFTTWLSVEI